MVRNQILIHPLIVTICLSTLTACTTDSATNDFDMVCGYFEELKADPAENNMTYIERNQVIMKKLTDNLAENSNARVAWQAISNAQASERYELFRSAASSTGLDNWQCSAMQELADKTGEFE